MKYVCYTVIMERVVNGEVVREQAKAWSVEGLHYVIRAYKMANLGWKIADLPYNNRARRALGEI